MANKSKDEINSGAQSLKDGILACVKGAKDKALEIRASIYDIEELNKLLSEARKLPDATTIQIPDDIAFTKALAGGGQASDVRYTLIIGKYNQLIQATGGDLPPVIVA